MNSTFIAFRHGNRYLYIWIGILIHALNVENLCYWIPDLDNFWQAQGFLTLFGMRAPLSVIFGIFHVFDYISYVFVQRYYILLTYKVLLFFICCLIESLRLFFWYYKLYKQ